MDYYRLDADDSDCITFREDGRRISELSQAMPMGCNEHNCDRDEDFTWVFERGERMSLWCPEHLQDGSGDVVRAFPGELWTTPLLVALGRADEAHALVEQANVDAEVAELSWEHDQMLSQMWTGIDLLMQADDDMLAHYLEVLTDVDRERLRTALA